MTAVAWGLACFGWICIAAALLPASGAPARPWLSWVLLTLAIVFFLIAAALGFGWIKA